MDFTAIVSSKGQVTIPQTIRTALGLHQGSLRVKKGEILEIHTLLKDGLRCSLDVENGRKKQKYSQWKIWMQRSLRLSHRRNI